MTAPRVACEHCGRKHQSDRTAAKCEATAFRAAASAEASGAALPVVSAADVVVEPQDVLDALHLLDGRLVRQLGRSGSASVIAVSPTWLGDHRPLPGQIAHQHEIARLLVDLSGADPYEVARAFTGTIRAGKSLATIIPAALLELAAADLTDRARALAARPTSTLRSAA